MDKRRVSSAELAELSGEGNGGQRGGQDVARRQGCADGGCAGQGGEGDAVVITASLGARMGTANDGCPAGLADIPAPARRWAEPADRLSRDFRKLIRRPARGRGDRAGRRLKRFAASADRNIGRFRSLKSDRGGGKAGGCSGLRFAAEGKMRHHARGAASSATPPPAKSGAGAQAKRAGQFEHDIRAVFQKRHARARSHLSCRANAPRWVSAPLIRQST